MAPPEVSEAGPGAQVFVGRYRMERLLRHRSANDAIYEAHDLETERTVELRVIARPPSAEVRARFETEAALLAGLHHPQLPVVYEFGVADEGMYLATERLEGRTLAETIRDGRLPPARAVRLLGGVADALDAAHSEGLTHGDVTLEHVVVVERHDDHPYLVDFMLGGPYEGEALAATTVTGDVWALARALYDSMLREDAPPELVGLLSEIAAATGAASRYSAGQLMDVAARTLVDGHAPSPPADAVAPPEHSLGDAAEPRVGDAAAFPVGAAGAAGGTAGPSAGAASSAPAGPAGAAASAPVAAPTRAPRRSPLSARVPAIAGVAAVLLAGAAGLAAGGPPWGDEGPATAGSGDGLELTLPDGWTSAAEAPALPGLDLENAAAAAAADGGAALVAGQLPGLRGSVHTAAVAEAIDGSPPEPEPVRLQRYEALRYAGLDAGEAGKLTLFVAPTSAGTLAAVCLPAAPRAACERAAASIELSDASASGLAAGEAFAARVDRVLRTLERRRSSGLGRLRAARTSGAQADAAGALSGAHRSARRSLAGGTAPPAAAPARGELVASLAALGRAYARLARAAAGAREAAYAAARRSVQRTEADLRALLRAL